MAEKRTRLDIIGDMLESIINKGGHIKQTHLMYKSILSHRQMREYLEELVEKDLVHVNKSRYEYIIITDRGREFFHKLIEMREFEKAFGL